MPADADHRIHLRTPSAVRYPRGAGPGVAIEPALTTLPLGKAEVRRESKRCTHRIAILAFGAPVSAAASVADKLDATLVNMQFVKPLDVGLVLDIARTHMAIVTVEENVIAGGAGSAVAEWLAAHGVAMPMLHLGLPDVFIDHGDPAFLLAHVGLDGQGILRAIEARFGSAGGSAVKPAA